MQKNRKRDYRLDHEASGPTFLHVIQDVELEVSRIIGNEEQQMYFYALALCYSFAENSLKYLNWNYAHWEFVQAWDPESDDPPPEMAVEQQEALTRTFLRRTTFAESIKRARVGALRDYPELADRLDSLRLKRNDVLHQLWLWKQRRRPKSLLAELRRAEEICRDLVARIADFSSETGDIVLLTTLDPDGR